MDTRARTVTLVSAVLGLLATGFAALAGRPAPPLLLLLGVAALGVLSAQPRLLARLPGRDVGLTVAATVLGAAVQPSPTVVAAVAGGAVLPVLLRRQLSVRALAAPVRTLLDAGTTVATAAALVSLLPGGAVVGAAAAALGSLVGQLARALSAALSVAARSRLRSSRGVTAKLLRRAVRAAAPASTAAAATAATLVVVAERAPSMLLVLLVPLVVGLVQAAVNRRREAVAGMLGALLERQRELAGASHDRSADEVLTALARLLGGADVRMVLVTGSGPVELLGDEQGVTVRRPADGLGRWPRQTVGRRTVAGRQVVVLAVGTAASPAARLEATRPAGAPALRSSERAAVLALAHQAAGWLAVAPAPDEPGEHEWDGLREQVSALRRAATGSDLGEVLAALQEVRTATAVLAGAAPVAATQAAWTSTGTRA